MHYDRLNTAPRPAHGLCRSENKSDCPPISEKGDSHNRRSRQLTRPPGTASIPQPGAGQKGQEHGNMMMLTREQARQEVRARWKEFGQPDKGGKGIICPFCGNGEGQDGDGIRENPRANKPGQLKCFKCGWTGDSIDIYMKEYNLDYNRALQAAADFLGYEIEPYRPTAADDFKDDTDDRAQGPQRDADNADKETPTGQNKAPQAATGTATGADYTAYYLECAERLDDPAALSYLKARGISRETAAAYHLGYDAQWISPTVVQRQRDKGSDWTPPATARLIMPVSKNHYVARAISPNTEKKYQKMNETGGGSAAVFNFPAIQQARPVFVVEGVIDALSIIEAGGQAIALNSTSNAEKLIKVLEKRPTETTFILCLDNDAAGQRATGVLKDGLNRLNIGFIISDVSCGQNDPNDALCADRDKFIKAIQAAELQTAARPDSVAVYMDTIMGDDIARFKSDVKTGFKELDRLSGGLYPGLYGVGAISSLGKTTFMSQVADQIAGQGIDVLFFSMEQSRLEMVSKSLARITAQHDLQNFVTSLSIRKGYLPDRVKDAAREYLQKTGDRMNIIEGNFNCNISFIGDYIRRYIRQNDCRPVVFIDYLQILQPTDDGRKRATVKETVDAAITELKRISREFNITVFIISSINRANYLTPIDFESFKESGGIEYTCDVVWGLQLQCLNEPLFSKTNAIKEKRERVKQAKAATPRKIELVCLKNRYGIANYSCGFNYYPAADLFTEDTLGFDFDSLIEPGRGVYAPGGKI